jgi:hypothetical protein
MSILAAAGCQKGASNPCEELAQLSPPGVVLADDEVRCGQLLDFAATVHRRYGMDFPEWIATVPAQRAQLLVGTLDAVTRGKWNPVEFGPEPAIPPCGPGSRVSDDQWNRTPLSTILATRPDRLFVSVQLVVDRQKSVLTMRILQDFDCDHVLGVTEHTGLFDVGKPLIGGGWTSISSVDPALDE